jgi:hypothetical protein
MLEGRERPAREFSSLSLHIVLAKSRAPFQNSRSAATGIAGFLNDPDPQFECSRGHLTDNGRRRFANSHADGLLGVVQ